MKPNGDDGSDQFVARFAFVLATLGLLLALALHGSLYCITEPTRTDIADAVSVLVGAGCEVLAICLSIWVRQHKLARVALCIACVCLVVLGTTCALRPREAPPRSSVRWDKSRGDPSVCEVHHVPMLWKMVPYCHGMIPMHSSFDNGAFDRRMAHYPHPGDCEPATDLVMPGQEGLTGVYACPECERVQRQMEKANQ